MSLDVFDRQGRPITNDEWARLRTKEYLEVAQSRVGVSGDQVHVSTVWLGLNHRYGDGPPIIFETLVFGGSLDQTMDRYSTEAEALAGHEAMCKRVQAS